MHEIAARQRLMQAALRALAADYADEHAHASDESQYADDELERAARAYVESRST